jgi:hypothetical protein
VKPFKKYDVTLRRDVQQVAHVRVEAGSPQEAIDVAESAVSGLDAPWAVEEHIGSHKPQARPASVASAKLDRDRRAHERRWAKHQARLRKERHVTRAR